MTLAWAEILYLWFGKNELAWISRVIWMRIWLQGLVWNHMH